MFGLLYEVFIAIHFSTGVTPVKSKYKLLPLQVAHLIRPDGIMFTKSQTKHVREYTRGP